MRNKNNPRSEENPLPTSPLAGGGASIPSLDKGRARVGLSLPKLRFPEFLGAGEWEVRKIGEVGDVVTGKTPSTSDESLWNGEVHFVTPTDIIESKYQLTTQRTVSLNEKMKVLPEKSVMFTCIASIGKMSLSTVPCITNQQINSIIPYKNYDNEYIYYSILSITDFIKSTQANTTLPIINKTEFSKIEIILPTLPEQQKIADCLSTLDDRIEAENQKLAQLKTHKKALMQQLFPAEGETVPRLRFAEFLGAGEWEVKKLGDLAKKITIKNKDEKIVRVLTNSAIDGIMDQRDYFEKDIADKDNLSGYIIVSKGDYIYNPRISNIAPVGPISKNNIGLGVMSPLYTVFRFNYDVNDFYSYYFKSPYWHIYLREFSNSGARHDRMSISNDDFMKMPLPFPTLPEQQKISDCLSSLDELINLQTQKIATLKTHKKGMMQQLFPQNTNEGTV